MRALVMTFCRVTAR